MRVDIKPAFFHITFILLIPALSFAQTRIVCSDQWTATDELGRKLPVETKTGNLRKEKYVGIFYWTWHTDANAAFSPIMNTSEILRNYTAAAGNADHPAWKGIDGGVFWWDEPLFGYYRSTDEWVLRKHAELLADARIDAVFFDCTNGNITWKSSYMKLLQVWEQARKDGVNTPRIVFLLPFEPCNNGLSSLEQIYQDIYKPGLYKNLWFIWHGKPLIMSYFEKLDEITADSLENNLRREIRSFFTFRPPQPDYVNGPSRNDQWGWLENFPQHGYVKKYNGSFEQVTVGVAQNANDSSRGHWHAFNAAGTYGRSYTKSHGQDPRPDAYFYGLNFQEQWSRAFELDPDFVFITGWNEWIAGRFLNLTLPTSPPYKPFGFIDEYNAEKSRDIEPVKAWGDKGDVYYLQLIANVRRFKGMESQELASGPKTIDIANISSWAGVKPEFLSYKGNTLHRNHPGQGNELIYTNTTGRNDIIAAKVARDSAFLYFCVETAEKLTDKNDPKWMRLFIDIDRNKATGWEGYDFIINRTSPGDSALIEKSQGSWNWEKVGNAEYSMNDKFLVIKIKQSFLGIKKNENLNFEFKWSDNMQEDGNIMDFYVNGDVAPGGRFNYVYQVK